MLLECILLEDTKILKLKKNRNLLEDALQKITKPPYIFPE